MDDWPSALMTVERLVASLREKVLAARAVEQLVLRRVVFDAQFPAEFSDLCFRCDLSLLSVMHTANDSDAGNRRAEGLGSVHAGTSSMVAPTSIPFESRSSETSRRPGAGCSTVRLMGVASPKRDAISCNACNRASREARESDAKP
jgi:hypothetical protein